MPRSALQRSPAQEFRTIKPTPTPSQAFRDIEVSATPVLPSRILPEPRSPVMPSTILPEHRSRSPVLPSRAAVLSTPLTQFRASPVAGFRDVQVVPSTPSTQLRSPMNDFRILQQENAGIPIYQVAGDRSFKTVRMPGPPRAPSKPRAAVDRGHGNTRMRRVSRNDNPSLTSPQPYQIASPSLLTRALPVDPSSSSVAVVVAGAPRSPGLQWRIVGSTDVSLTSPTRFPRVLRSTDVSIASSPPMRSADHGLERSYDVARRDRIDERSLERDRQMHDQMKLNVSHTLAMLPASPPNTLVAFLADVAAGNLKPASAHVETRIDTARFWENRRVQNSLRRVLEALQEHFDIMQPEELGNKAFEAMMRKAQNRGRLGFSTLDEASFSRALLDLNLWPSEMTEDDRTEAFLALTHPNAKGVVNILPPEGIGKMSTELNNSRFCEGLSRVPYNLPDFPVPTIYLNTEYTCGNSSKPNKEKVLEVCYKIAEIFCESTIGLERVKDYFLCGLLSCEEIQACLGLDCLVPAALVDDAVMKIIRNTAKYFTHNEWQEMVHNVRMNPDLNGEVVAAERQHTMPEPMSEPADETQPQDALESRVQADPLSNFMAEDLTSISIVTSEHQNQSFEDFTSENRTLAAGARTDPSDRPTSPSPSRELLKEDVVIPVLSQMRNRMDPVVDWSTPQHRTLVENGSSERVADADEGAGTQHSRSYMAEASLETETSQILQVGRETLPGDDPVAWISLEMQNECRGPYLSKAFRRCCQIFQSKYTSSKGRAHLLERSERSERSETA